MIDIEPLLAAAPQAPPFGPDLEYDPDYLALEQLARGKEEKRSGDTVIPAEAPRWGEVADKACALLQRSKDLRVACTLLRACVHVDGLVGFVAGMRLVVRLLEQYWEGIHPLLDADDHNDPTMRLNALAPIADPQGLLRELREATLIRSRQHGQILVRDVEIALNKLPPRAGAAVLTQAQVEAALAAGFAEDGAAVAPVGAALAAVKALASFLDGQVGPARAPDFKPLLATLQSLAVVVHEQVAAEPQPAPAPLDPEGNAIAVPQGAAAAALPGEIRSRDDALLMIDKVIRYLEANEPTNPAPMLLKRGKRFMTMSFTEIVKEIAPESIDKLSVIAGPQDAV